MKTYIGTKILQAEPMNLGDYNKFKGWIIPEDEDPLKEGYKVVYPDNYISWSPKEVFEESYREYGKMTFGLAIEAAKMGKAIQREGWNGKGMFVAYSPGSNALPADRFWSPANKEYVENNGGTCDVLPCLTMKTADNKILMGWLASQTDMLAEDWQIVE